MSRFFDMEMDNKDFLQDPEMWVDKLPQPYRLVDSFLNRLLDVTWDKIEERELLRQRAAAQVQVPSGAGGVVLCEDVLMQVCGGVECGEGTVTVVGNGTSVCALRCGWSGDDSDRSEDVMQIVVCTPSDVCTVKKLEKKVEYAEVLEQMNMDSSINKLSVVQKSGVLMIMVQLDTGIYII